MALRIQDATGLIANANTYVSLIYFVNFWEELNLEFSQEDETLEASLIRATRYIDRRFSFKGYKINGRNQTTEWPREQAYDDCGEEITGIPIEILTCVCEYAKIDLDGQLFSDTLTGDSGAAVVEESTTVGPITTTVKYATPNSVDDFAGLKPHEYVDRMLDGIIENSSNVRLISR